MITSYDNIIHIMTTISVPLKPDQEKFIREYIASGKAENKAQTVRRALKLLAEEEAINAVLEAEKEPSLSGDLSELAERLR